MISGNVWETVEAPLNSSLKQVSVGENGVWALDSNGRIFARSENTEVFPLGSHWRAMSFFSHEENLNG